MGECQSCGVKITKEGHYLCYDCWKEDKGKSSKPKKKVNLEDLITSTIVTQILEEKQNLKISSRKLNSIFNELGWIAKPPYDMGGWQVTRRGRKVGGIDIPPPSGGSPYVKWQKKIATNRALIHAVRDMLGSSAEEPLERPSENESVAHNAPNRSKTIKTRDGHYVASRGEALIDNFLYGARIAHAYEQELYLGEEAKPMIPDFTALTPKGNVYIEFWGMEGKPAYDKRKEIKKRLYSEYGLELVEVYPKHLDYIDAYLNKIFAKYGVRTAF
jgi:hypothetical protein